MGITKRCFASVETLRRRNPEVLRALLALFPDHLASRGLTLPQQASHANLDYAGVRDALMEGDIPEDLDDILYLSSILGNAKGWSMIERQMQEDTAAYLRFSANHDYADLAVLAAIQNWPRHKGLLEKAIARARVHSKSAYEYYAPALDLRGRFQDPTEQGLAMAREQLCTHFVGEGMVDEADRRKATEIIPYTFKDEIWFLVRYPGRRARMSGYTGGDWQNFVFNPEQYDAVAYNKVYGDLRMNTNRKREHARYRITFGHLLFNQSGGFREKAAVVTLAPLQQPNGSSLFACDDIPGLTMIRPIALTYETLGPPLRQWAITAPEGESLLDGNPYAPQLVPSDTHQVCKAVFQYRLSDSARLSRLTVTNSNKVTFERDGDSVVVERWLRRRGFVKTFVELDEHESDDLDGDLAVAANA